MGISLDGNGSYNHTTTLTASGSYSACVWFKPSGLPTAGSYYDLFASEDAVGLTIHGEVGSAHFSVTDHIHNFVNGTALTSGVWYFGALSVVASGGAKTGYLATVGGGLASDSSAGSSNNIVAGFNIGTYRLSLGGDRFQGTLAGIKVWDGVVLTLTDFQQEMAQISPVRTANLVSFYPLLSTSDDETDFSGNGRTLTVNGSGHATADGPSVPYVLGPLDWLPHSDILQGNTPVRFVPRRSR